MPFGKITIILKIYKDHKVVEAFNNSMKRALFLLFIFFSIIMFFHTNPGIVVCRKF